MINLEEFLQVEFTDSCDFSEIKVTPSLLQEFDYQASVYKIVTSGKKQELEDFLSHSKIVDMFDYVFTSSGKQYFLSFKTKESYLILLLNTFYNFSDIENYKLVLLVPKPQKVLYDYSSPNLAKDMHVGHLRSTILGDTLANISEYLGHQVTRVNHIGDFGLPFGMIVQYVMQNNIVIDESTSLQKLYVEAKKTFEKDQEFSVNAYIRTAELQMETNAEVVLVWKQIYEHSLKSYQNIYELLSISKQLKICGESFYVKYIDQVKQLLDSAGFIKVDDKGRTIIQIDKMNPLIYEKSEEKGSAYTYDTTDAVCLWYRTQVLKQDQIYYVVDVGQGLHFKQLFQLGKQIGWLNENVTAEHIAFGIISDTNGKISSRMGDTPKLLDLIEDGINETTKTFSAKSECSDPYTIKNVAIGSIKYFDLTKVRTTQYVFDFNQMLKSDANTFSYISYSIARCMGVTSKFNDAKCVLPEDLDYDKLVIEDFNILRKISEFPTILTKVEKTKMPHYLCDYLNNLSALLHYGYHNTRCLEFDKENKIISFNESRITLYMFVHHVLKTGCKLLSMPIVDKM